MWYYWLLFLCYGLGILNLSAQTKPKEVSSTIERVVVFLDGAQIIRKAQVYIATGKSEIVFRGISPFVDKESIQIKGEGNFTVLSVVHQNNFLLEQTQRGDIERLEKRLEDIQEKIILQKSYLEVYEQEEKMLSSNQEIRGENSGLNVADLQAAINFHRQRLTEVKLKKIETNKKIKELAEESLKIQKQLQALNAEKDLATSEILVKLDSKQALSAKFEVSYLVSRAGWYPYYDLRVKDVKSPIQLIYRANVYQSSGENWNKVKLTLSNANPNQSGIKPDLNPWYLSFNRPYQVQDIRKEVAKPTSATIRRQGEELRGRVTDDVGSSLPGVNVVIKGTNIGTITDAQGNFYLDAPPNSILIFSYVGFSSQEINIGQNNQFDIILQEDLQALNEVVVVAYGSERKKNRSKGTNRKDDFDGLLEDKTREFKTEAIPITENLNTTSVTFDIDIPYTIPSDGKTYAVDIKEETLQANYSYASVPKLETDAFLTAQVIDWQEYNLLPGEASLFFEGTYLGKTTLDVSTLKDTLPVSLGRDQNVLVSRTRAKDFKRRQTLGSNQVETRTWKIQVRNRKRQAIHITLEDQLPISKMKEVNVEALELSGAILDIETGKIRWELDLAPSQEKELIFSYQVKYPKNRQIYLE